MSEDKVVMISKGLEHIARHSDLSDKEFEIIGRILNLETDPQVISVRPTRTYNGMPNQTSFEVSMYWIAEEAYIDIMLESSGLPRPVEVYEVKNTAYKYVRICDFARKKAFEGDTPRLIQVYFKVEYA